MQDQIGSIQKLHGLPFHALQKEPAQEPQVSNFTCVRIFRLSSFTAAANGNICFSEQSPAKSVFVYSLPNGLERCNKLHWPEGAELNRICCTYQTLLVPQVCRGRVRRALCLAEDVGRAKSNLRKLPAVRLLWTDADMRLLRLRRPDMPAEASRGGHISTRTWLH